MNKKEKIVDFKTIFGIVTIVALILLVDWEHLNNYKIAMFLFWELWGGYMIYNDL